MPKLKAKIWRSKNLRMAGKELRRLRVAAGLSEKELAERFGTYRMKIQRLEKAPSFELQPQQMQELLKALGAGTL